MSNSGGEWRMDEGCWMWQWRAKREATAYAWERSEDLHEAQKAMDLRDRYEVGLSGSEKVRTEEDDPIKLPVSFMGK